MDYRVASNIRGKSLSSLMADKITSGSGVGSALSGAISEKLKAKATGVKEKFDPMNIAKFMTGGSRLAPAILGRLTGRSQSDINYFAGEKNKKGNYTQVPTSMSTPGEGLGGSAVDILNKMLSFLVNSRERDLKKKETAKQFLEEQKVEEQRRQDEFLKLLKEYTSLSTSTVIRAEEGNNMLDNLKRMLDALAYKFNSMLDAINVFKNPKALASLVGLLTNPLGWTIGAIIAARYGLTKLAEYTPNYSVLSPKEAQAVLERRDAIETQQFGGYDKLADIIRNGPAEAQKALDDFKAGRITEPEINKLGGVKKLEEIASQTGLAVPENVALPDRVQPRPERRGQSQMMWDQRYGKDYNPDGTRKPTQVPNTGTTPAPAATPMPNESSAPPAGNQSSAQPVQQTPSSARMNDAVGENQDLNLMSNVNTQTPVAPIVTTNTNSVDLPDRTIPATALVRDKTPILAHVLNASIVPV